MPVGGWVQPLSGGGHAEAPESKRRFANLVRRSGLDEVLDASPPPMTEPRRRADVTRDRPDPLETVEKGRGRIVGLLYTRIPCLPTQQRQQLTTIAFG